MGPQTVVTIHPECIKPGVPLPANPVRLDALKFNMNDLAHSLFFTGKDVTRGHPLAPRYLSWPFGVRWSVRRLYPNADPSLSKQLQRNLKSRLNNVRAHVEPRKAPAGTGNYLMLTTLGQKLTGPAQGRLSEDLGLAMMGLYCYETLDVVQLLGTSLAEKCFIVTPRILQGKTDKRRPDFIGFDAYHNAIIAEAKGRRGNLRLPALAADVDDQLKSVRAVWIPDSVSGRVVNCRHYHRIGCIASFKSFSSPLRLHVVDDRCWPAPGPLVQDDIEPLDANMRSELLYRYYSYTCAAVGYDQRTLRNLDAGSFQTVELPGITFGVLDSIFELVERTGSVDPNDLDALQGFAGEIDDILGSLDLGDLDSRDQDARNEGMFRDGTVFQAAWHVETEDALPEASS